METIVDRLDRKIRTGPTCWEWQAGKSTGYAAVWLDGSMVYAHRLVYELLVGPIPEGLELDHTCRNPACVNPDHLEPVTHAVNVQRGNAGRNNAVKTACPAGHPYDEANTYRPPNGGRVCRACKRKRYAASRSLAAPTRR